MWIDLGKQHLAGQPFGINEEQLRSHAVVLGQTGVGKSTMLRNMFVQHIQGKHGCGLIDPHGDLARELIDLIPANRVNDTVYFDATDREHPPAMNILSVANDENRHLLCDGIVNSMKGIWRDSWGPRLEHILYNTVAALLSVENSTVLGISRMLVDEGYRKWVVRQVRDPAIKRFWRDEFGQWDVRYRREAIGPVQNKVGRLWASPVLRNIVGQSRNRIDADWIMDDGKIFIANLAKGEIGEETARLIGSLLFLQFETASMKRANREAGARRPFHLMIDEFHNFVTDSFAGVLSETRKYGLALILSHQYMGQLPPPLREAVFGNVALLLGFRMSASDAEHFARELTRNNPRHLVELPRFDVLARIPGESHPRTVQFTAHKPMGKSGGASKSIRQYNRDRYASPRAEIEERLNRWWGREF